MATYISESGYKLKYRWTGYDNRGKAVQLDIYQKSSSSFSLTYIGGLKDLNLKVQGGQGSIYAPIIKSSLDITLVDAPDEVVSGYKYGDWEEFYTPDSTKYLVKLYRCWQGSTQTLEWQGYITPDSWQESLSYRGAITITARDNIGHLQDFDFDATGDKYGLIQIFNGSTGLLDLAMAKIAFPMAVTHNTSGDAQFLRDQNAYSLLGSKVNVSKFDGQSWYSAVESTLEAIGYCLRFVGGGFMLQPIRNLPLLGYTSRSTAHAAALDVEFYGGDRSNDPAYRELKEVVDYDSQDEVSYDIHRNLSFGSSYITYAGRQYKPRNQSWDTFTGRVCSNTNTNGATQGGWLFDVGYGFVNPTDCNIQSTLEAEDGAKAMELGIPLAADQTTDGSLQPTYRMACCTTDVTITCEFARPVELKNASAPFNVARLKDYMAKARLYIKYTDPQSGTVYYWNGAGWQTSSVLTEVDIADTLAESYSFEVALGDISETATLGGWLDIGFANFLNYGEDAPDYGSFVRLTAIKTKLNAKSVLKSDTVTTINSDEYNVKIQRKPEVGAMSAAVPYFSPANYPGALWQYGGNGAPIPHGYANYWSGYNSSTAIPLPAQIHKQMLCFNHVSLRKLEGQMGCVYKADSMTYANEIYYKGHYYLIQSGNLDVLHNRMNGALLHEYVWYDSLWNENNNPAYSGVPVFDTKSASGNVNGTGSRAGGGGSSSGGGGGGGGADGTVKSVGLSMPAGFSTSGSPITTSGTIQVSFANGYSLLTDADKSKWDVAYGWGDHSQAGYIKGITYNMVISALGFTPAQYADINALQTRMDNAESDIDALQAAIGGGGEGMLHAPTIRIVRGYQNGSNSPITPYLEVTHPLLDAGINAVAVLMVWSKRRGRIGRTSTKMHPTYVSKWGEARGKLATQAPLTWTKVINLDDIRTFVLHNHMCGSYRTEATMRMMLLSSFNNMKPTDYKFGFKGKHAQSTSGFKAHPSRLFGIAIRYPNPEFAEYSTGTAAETTREIEGAAQGTKVKRYIYSDVTPIRLHVNTDSNGYWRIGFQLQPIGAPQKP